jgi:23S rRNA (uridine2552-2'-O)-methyltransferase
MPPATSPTDQLKIMALVEAGAEFAASVLRPGGSFLAKVLQGGTDARCSPSSSATSPIVKHVKPQASRADSSELYVLATGFRGSRSG